MYVYCFLPEIGGGGGALAHRGKKMINCALKKSQSDEPQKDGGVRQCGCKHDKNRGECAGRDNVISPR